MTTLREEIRKAANEFSSSRRVAGYSAEYQEFALTAIKLVLERPPSEAMILAGANCRNEQCGECGPASECAQCVRKTKEDFMSMTAQLLKELDANDIKSNL